MCCKKLINCDEDVLQVKVKVFNPVHDHELVVELTIANIDQSDATIELHVKAECLEV